MRTVLGASIVAALLWTGCAGDDDSLATTDSAPVTLGELDGVVITVAQEDLVGEPIRLEDTDDDGEVEIVEVETLDEDAPDGAAVESEVEFDETNSGDEGLNPLGGDDPEDKRMPDVICMGLQAAQDEIQDRGVFFSKSVDATGEGRRQLWDRNWIVVAQDPAPGEPIGENEATLAVVKKDEDNDC